MLETSGNSELTERPTVYGGIDWHSRTATLHVRDAAGVRLPDVTVAARHENVIRHLQPFVPHLVAGVEATSGASDLADALHAAGIPCLIGDASRMRSMFRGQRKSDRRDAESIAILLAQSKFPEIYQPTREIRLLRQILRRRASLVSFRQGERAQATQRKPRWRGYGSVDTCLVAGTAADSHDILLEKLDKVDALLTPEIDDLQATATALASRAFPVFPRLTAIPGVGPINAAVICAEIGIIERFARPENLISYARLVVRTEKSGAKITRWDNPKSGNRQLEQTFVNAAHSVIQHCEPAKNWIQHWFPSLSQKKLATKAVARRLAEGVYQVWKKQVAFDVNLAFPPIPRGQNM